MAGRPTASDEIDALLDGPPPAALTPEQEQTTRNRYKYDRVTDPPGTKRRRFTETRTQAERQATAAKILEVYIAALPSAYRIAVSGELETFVVSTEAEAAELGRRYGTDEADRRGETGDKRAIRISGAIRYGVWEWRQKTKPSRTVPANPA